MLSRFHDVLLFSVLLIGLVVLNGQSHAEEPKTKKPSSNNFTHIIAAETEYYTTGPQQGRPADGKFQAETKVKLLRKAGSYSQVKTEKGVVAYVATDTLKPIGANAVKRTFRTSL